MRRAGCDVKYDEAVRPAVPGGCFEGYGKNRHYDMIDGAQPRMEPKFEGGSGAYSEISLRGFGSTLSKHMAKDRASLRVLR